MMPFKVLEFFAGIGGAARSFEGIGNIQAAFDINENAAQVYSKNFDHPYYVKSVEDITANEISAFEADTWWLSAPCQPFTRRGNQRDDRDPRAHALRSLMQQLDKSPPLHFCLENVFGFEQSNMRNDLRVVLEQKKFQMAEIQTCPTEIGVPNKRPRYYLFASQCEFDERILTARKIIHPSSLERYLDTTEDRDLWLEPEVRDKYLDGLNIVNADSTASNCFTSGYGKSVTKCGSYFRGGNNEIRRFSPTEVAKLLGFWGPELNQKFEWPSQLTHRQLWKLLGNSISVFVVRDLLKKFALAVAGVQSQPDA